MEDRFFQPPATGRSGFLKFGVTQGGDDGDIKPGGSPPLPLNSCLSILITGKTGIRYFFSNPE
ncbi:MAG: hypothetical protein ACYCOO_01940 [Chitinophagaceae bacterium]